LNFFDFGYKYKNIPHSTIITNSLNMTSKIKFTAKKSTDPKLNDTELDNESNEELNEDIINDPSVAELTIEEQFQKMKHEEHALELPDTYIGSVEAVEEPMWVIDESSDQTNSGASEQEGNSLLADDEQSISEQIPSDDDKSTTTTRSRNTSRSVSRSSEGGSSTSGAGTGEAEKGMTRMIIRKIRYVPGLYKIYDEVLVNAIDHWTRMDLKINTQDAIKKGTMSETPEVKLKMKFKPVKNIKISIDQVTGMISVLNDGDGIPIAMHEQEGVYVPEMLFSQFLTSGNYKGEKVNQTKIIGGKNGYGAKLAALFSTEFTIETVDFTRHKKYVQVYRNNLKEINPPEVTNYMGVPYTKITFCPDFKRFGMTGLTDDMLAMFKKRVYDAAGWCTGVNVFYNDFRIPIRDFNQYMNLYLGSRNIRKRFFMMAGERWEVGATYSDHQEFQQISMVNGIFTSKGGRHVTYIADQIAKKLAKEISTEKNIVDQRTVKANLWLFLRCVIENPNFDSQTKEALTTQVAKFGSKCELSTEDILKIGRVGISKRSKDFSMFKETLTSKTTDGKKVNRVSVDKLEDADYAGKKNSEKCVLILTEGDSAKGFALQGLKALTAEERKYYGVFPLKGKMLNVRDAKQKQIDDNDEIASLKKILALQSGVDYSGPDGIKKLRYGKIMILTDSDHDGDHIKGLVINFIHKFWPSLLDTNDFITTMITPIVIAWKERKVGRKTEKYNIIKFYSENQFYEWKKHNNDGRGWKSRYYKGLATSKEEDAQECFRESKMIQYMLDPVEEDQSGRKISPSDDAINLAFLQKNADLRKKWLQEANLDYINEYNINKETYSEFINHRLVQFSWADTYRSIPNICDGLKPSMRKIIYFCLKNRVNDSLKVAQLGGKVSNATSYHHGEKSLEGTIVGLAQDYVGSNNINLLRPEGMFGTRFANGKDAGSARYIYTKLEDMTPFIFRTEDSMLYKYLTDDGFPIEPEWYLPIIPMALVNGANGIGTGWSTYIPQYNPLDLVARLRKLLNGHSVIGTGDPVPWYRGFTGKIQPGVETNGFVSNYTCIGDYQIYQNRVRVKELPIDGCFSDYKKFLEDLIRPVSEEERKKRARDKSSYNAYTSVLWGQVKDVHIDSSLCQAEIVFKDRALNELLGRGVDKFEKELKLRNSLPVTNMVLFSPELEIRKYSSVNEIIETYFAVRLKYYGYRHRLLIGETDFDLQRVNSKLRFVTEIMNEKLVIYKKTRSQIIELLKANNYPMYVSQFDPRMVLGELYDQKDAVVETVQKVDDLDSNEGLEATVSGDRAAEFEGDLDGDDDQEGGAKSKKGGRTVASYSYLLSMKIDSFSQEMLNKLQSEVNVLQAKLDKYNSSSPKQMWEEDLINFEREYIGWLTDWYDEKKINTPELKSKIVMNVGGVSRRKASGSGATKEG
jgi:DNA topoisomerase-2